MSVLLGSHITAGSLKEDDKESSWIISEDLLIDLYPTLLRQEEWS